LKCGQEARDFNGFGTALLFNYSSFRSFTARPRGGRQHFFTEALMHPMLNTAIKAARRAATVINRASFDLDRITVSEKSHNNFVTDIDQASEQAIVETLLKAYPDHAILGEESGPSSNLNDDSEYDWIIDPIDGTTNFMHGYPNFCISIALQQRGATTSYMRRYSTRSRGSWPWPEPMRALLMRSGLRTRMRLSFR
jgi:hypothetical protein